MAFPSKERNKLIFAILLLGLAVFALYRAFWAPSAPGPSVPALAKTGQAKTLAAIANPKLPAAQRRGGARGAAKAPSGPIDPKLQLGQLSRSATIAYEPAGGRNIFAYGAPPPPLPKPAPLPPPSPFPQGRSDRSVGSMTTQIAIPFKLFGFVQDPTKRGLFLQDDEIIVAGEGDLIKKRYRIVKFGVNTAEVEDTVAKGRQVLQQEPP